MPHSSYTMCQPSILKDYFPANAISINEGGGISMKALDRYSTYKDCYEYHGGTTIEYIRKKGNVTILMNWLIFDSVEEAFDYYNDNCLV